MKTNSDVHDTVIYIYMYVYVYKYEKKTMYSLGHFIHIIIKVDEKNFNSNHLLNILFFSYLCIYIPL